MGNTEHKKKIFSGFPWFIRDKDETQEEYEERCKKAWKYQFSKKGLKETLEYYKKLKKEIDSKYILF